jgi:hypothetical protein
MTAFRATFADMKLVKTRQVAQLIFEIPIEDFDAAYEVLGGMPVPAKERWFGIAAIKSPEQKEDRAKPRQTLLPDATTGGAKREKMDWRDMQPAAQAGIRCEDPIFKAFLSEQYRKEWVHADKEADECVRRICGVQSRSELGTVHAARVIWKMLDDQFQAWKALEHA